MTTPEKSRWIADQFEKSDDEADRFVSEVLRDLANQVERIEAQRKELREALQWMVNDFGNTASEDVASLGKARAALKATQ